MIEKSGFLAGGIRISTTFGSEQMQLAQINSPQLNPEAMEHSKQFVSSQLWMHFPAKNY